MNTEPLLTAVHAWQRGALDREDLIARLTALGREDAPLLSELIGQLTVQAAPHGHGAPAADSPNGTDVWRDELMGSRARTWGTVGLLVGPSVLILTDGQRGVVLGERESRALSSSVSGSLMLLCQTIVMAEHALNEREMQHLREQRLQSASSSLSEIDPVQ
ncbi:hypothetical protein [Deinococcus radiotolerans]|uniref:Uncharacterized protein n=1 Tax=Deinococcus radiotolerans TaxID=1309407 RepID=A0ABQ2FHT9_9DEIO|nr:hypothetical protein [Deinococcus radiotolerans]GGK99902.1 hypothetical protein GCM10010844_17850 [Deinococcus radiotolerans]